MNKAVLSLFVLCGITTGSSAMQSGSGQSGSMHQGPEGVNALRYAESKNILKTMLGGAVAGASIVGAGSAIIAWNDLSPLAREQLKGMLLLSAITATVGAVTGAVLAIPVAPVVRKLQRTRAEMTSIGSRLAVVEKSIVGINEKMAQLVVKLN